ncbi:F-box protein At4g00755 isoform X1 [Morus notabilis]|uniref:F-box protein At4g00755 isoform X1 n=1 Tax=Morus notabilis TaxID=981085 RepID=UPI000CED1E96|nr:F-box protein At4g00755 isoform X1 [Morus notabilis]XP_024028681.1 F-box protein At4g00755 isoform X1 [Morus notabilis]
MPKADKNADFIYWLGTDISTKILTHLDDPADLVRVSSVSRLWHRFVVENGICRQLCFKKFPEISTAARSIEENNMIEPLKFSLRNNSIEWEFLKRKRRIYSFLAQGLSPVIRKDCISLSISASSTDNYPTESVHNTLEPRDRFENGPSYWSSSGKSDPDVPETLLYKLVAKLCVVTEIHVQPFEAYFQYGFPVYSCKAIRFRTGHLRNLVELKDEFLDNASVAHRLEDDRFVWTYISPEFPMAQENVLQKFELPEPALCVGGFLLVELLGRVQRQEIDGLYYICIAHVQVEGRPLSRPFDIEMLDPSGKCSFKYYKKAVSSESTLKFPISEVGTLNDLGSISPMQAATRVLLARGLGS